MNKTIYILLLLISNLLAGAQQFPVSIHINQTIAPPLFWNDYGNTTQTPFQVSVTLNDLATEPIEVNLYLQLIGAGLTLQSTLGSEPILLFPGETHFLTEEEVASIFNLPIQARGTHANKFNLTGMLPDGIHRLTLQAFEMHTKRPVSGIKNQVFSVYRQAPPQLLQPAKRSTISAEEQDYIIFSWLPKHQLQISQPAYEFQLFELPEGIAYSDYLITNRIPMHREETTQSELSIDPVAIGLIPGKTYAFRIQLTDPLQQHEEIYLNNGYSEINEFTYGTPCLPPTGLKVMETGSDYAKMEWDQLTFEEFTLHFTPFGGTESYSSTSSTNFSILEQLQADTKYQVRLSKTCGKFQSELSDSISFTTQKINHEVFSCSLPPQPDLEEEIGSDHLDVGSMFTALDFKVRVVEASSSSPFSGSGIAEMPFFKHATLAVDFEDIIVSESGKLISGNLSVLSGEIALPLKVQHFLDSLDQVLGMAQEVLNTAQEIIQTADSIKEANLITQIDENTANTPIDSTSISNGHTEISQDSILVSQTTNMDSTAIENVATSEDGGSSTAITGSSSSPVESNDTSTAPVETNTSTSTSAITNTSTNGGKNRQFGPINVELNEPPGEAVVLSSGLFQWEGLRGNVQLPIKTLGYEGQISIENAIISFKEDSTGQELESFDFSWEEDNGDRIEFEWMDLELVRGWASMDYEGRITGELIFRPHWKLKKEAFSLLTDAIITMEGKIPFQFENNPFAEGSFDFKDLRIPALILSRAGTQISQKEVIFNSSGIGTLQISTPSAFTYKEPYFSLKKASLELTFDVMHEIEWTKGIISGTLDPLPGINEEIRWSATVENNSFLVELEKQELTFQGWEMSEITAQLALSQGLEFQVFSASFKLKHAALPGSLMVDEMKIDRQGDFQLQLRGNLQVSPFTISVTSSSYDSKNAMLKLEAMGSYQENGKEIKVILHSVTIDADGNVDLGAYELQGNFQQQFGPVTLLFDSPPSHSNKDGSYLIYKDITVTAMLETTIKGVTKEVSIGKAVVSYKKMNSGEWKDFKLRIDDCDIPFLTINGFATRLLRIKLDIASFEQLELEGEMIVKTLMTEDVPFPLSASDPENLQIVLKKGMSLTTRIQLDYFQNETAGDIEIIKSTGAQVHLKKNGKKIAAIQTIIYEKGELTAHFVTSLPVVTTEEKGKVEISRLDLQVSFKPFELDHQFKLLQGTIKLKLTDLPATSGELLLTLHIDHDEIYTSTEGGGTIQFFGLRLIDPALAFHFTPTLDLKKIEGSMTVSLPAAGSVLVIDEFLYEDGQIKSFHSNGGQVTIKGFQFILEHLHLSEQYIIADASILMNFGAGNGANLKVSSFKITPSGTFEIGNIKGDIYRDPVLIGFDASYSDTRFKGSFKGKFGNHFEMGGALDIGSEQDFLFGYLALSTTANLPLAPGLKISSLSGNLGLNYALNYQTTTGTFSGYPKKGNYVAGLGLGVSDLANTIELYGHPIIQFGSGDTQLAMTGRLKMPVKNPILDAGVTANYNLTRDLITGNLTASVKIPASTGNILRADNNSFTFTRHSNGLYVHSTALTGAVFKSIEFDGSLDFQQSGDDITGELSGSARFHKIYSLGYEMSIGSIKGSLEIDFISDAQLTFTSTTLSGELAANLMGTATVEVSNEWLGSVEVSASFDGMGSVALQPSGAKFHGSLDFQMEALGQGIRFKKEIDGGI